MLDVFHDPFGKKCQEMFDDKTMERKPQPAMLVPKVPAVLEDVRATKLDPALSKRLEDTKLTEKVNRKIYFYFYFAFNFWNMPP